ncbi:MAG: CPBP family intramembrane metalloprotease [Solirubrobacterales bacterium]|nr:CPBP family intramembrane metalloprotease [Solirubrobacterales bacterium]
MAAGDDEVATALGLPVADLVLLAVVVAVAARGAQRLGPATLGIRRTAFWPAVGWGAAVLVGAWAFDGLLAVLAGGGGEEGGSGPDRVSATLALLAVVGIAVAAPVVEEISFRGYLFAALTRWRGPWLGAVVTALLFGVAHVFALPPVFLLGAAAFGFGMCLLFWFTGSLLPCVAVHSLNNAIVLAVATGGQLAWAIPAAPLASLLLLLPLARERAPQAAS